MARGLRPGSNYQSEKKLKIWDAASGTLLREIRGHGHAARGVAWSPDGRRLASSSLDHTVKVFLADTLEEVAVVTTPGIVRALAWDEAGEKLALAGDDRTVRIWKVGSGREPSALRGHTHAVSQAEWSPDGERVVSASYDGTVKVWDTTRAPEGRFFLGHDRSAWSPDGRYFAAANGAPSSEREDYVLAIFEVSTGRIVREITGMLDDPVPASVAWSPDGRRIAVSGWHGRLRVFDLVRDAIIADVRAHTDETRSIAWSPDGTLLASGGGTGSSRSGTSRPDTWSTPCVGTVTSSVRSPGARTVGISPRRAGIRRSRSGT